MRSKEQLFYIMEKLKKEEWEYLRELFSKCPDWVIDALRFVKKKKGQTLIFGGQPCDTVYIILHGCASGIDFQRIGTVYTFMEYSDTDIIGDFEVFGGIEAYGVTITATEDCELLSLPAKVYLEWMSSDVNALFKRTRKLMNTLTNENLAERRYLFLKGKDRLVLFLAESYMKHGEGGICKIKKTQSEIADRIGFNLRTVQRSIQSLEKEELIFVEGGKIILSENHYERLVNYIEEKL